MDFTTYIPYILNCNSTPAVSIILYLHIQCSIQHSETRGLLGPQTLKKCQWKGPIVYRQYYVLRCFQKWQTLSLLLTTFVICHLLFCQLLIWMHSIGPQWINKCTIIEPPHEIYNNLVCATSKASEPLLVTWIFHKC